MSIDPARDLIEQLVDIRKARGLTQQNVADRIHQTRASVAQVETCSTSPTLARLMRYAGGIGADLIAIPIGGDV